MVVKPQIAGTPAEIYEQHMVPAIFARWAPDLVEAAGVRPGGRGRSRRGLWHRSAYEVLVPARGPTGNGRGP